MVVFVSPGEVHVRVAHLCRSRVELVLGCTVVNFRPSIRDFRRSIRIDHGPLRSFFDSVGLNDRHCWCLWVHIGRVSGL